MGMRGGTVHGQANTPPGQGPETGGPTACAVRSVRTASKGVLEHGNAGGAGSGGSSDTLRP